MKKLLQNRKFLIIAGITIVLLIVAAIPAGYFYSKYAEAQLMLKDPQKAAVSENKKIIDKIARLLVIPMDETPTIATISDKDKLKNQPFFANAKNGDKVIIYTMAKKAILYDPIADKIIDVAPVNMGTSSATASPSASVSPTAAPLTIGLYNGTEAVGLTRTLERDIKAKYTQPLIIADRDNAKKTNYVKTLVVDLSLRKSADLTQIAASLKADYTTKLPEGESIPQSSQSASLDAMIIAGKDMVKPTASQ